MAGYYLCVDDLSLLFKELVFCYLFETLADINQLGVKFVDFAFLGQLKQVSLVVSIEINRNGFVASIGWNKADVEAAISTELSLIVAAS